MSLENRDEKSSPTERRGKVVLNAKIQLYYFSSIALSVFLMIGAFLSLLLFAGYTNLAQNWIALTAMMVMFALAPAFGIHSILHTHRIAGPIYHIQKGIKKIAEGHFDTSVELRQKDYLQDLALSFNEMAESLQKKQARWGEIALELKELKANLSGEPQKKLEAILQKMGMLQ